MMSNFGDCYVSVTDNKVQSSEVLSHSTFLSKIIPEIKEILVLN